jgi:protein-S-isoprenylcysteine O-methyltransferase Ste14
MIMDLPALLYALTILHAGYLIQLSFRQPSSKTISTKSESWLMWIAASPVGMIFARIVTLVIAVHQAIISLSLTRTFPNRDRILQTTCPTPEYLDPNLFTWSKSVIASLLLLYLGSSIRFQAYAQLGTNFTYRIAKPDQLVTSGLYAYVRHPSYTGLLSVLLAMYSLFFRQRGLVSCWAPLVDKKMITDERHAYLVPLIGFSCTVYLFTVRRVREEEEMMEKEFGQQWREHCKKTKKFIPYVY